MTYHASGGVVFAREHVPMTLQRAAEALAIHLSNRDLWLSRMDLSRAARLGMAKIETELADQLARAIEAARSDTKEAA
jgi:hypothetical protein